MIPRNATLAPHLLELPLGEWIRDIPPHCPQVDFPLELTPRKIDHTAPPPPHNQGSSIAEHLLQAKLQQSLENSSRPLRRIKIAEEVPIRGKEQE